TKEQLLKVSEEFLLKWQFPNCIGAIDGKHFHIKKPPKRGSEYYNYKHFFLWYFKLWLMQIINLLLLRLEEKEDRVTEEVFFSKLNK
ncbi:MAG: hypothetical protein KTM48_01545, partial [Wolbachia endosymbiont of Pissodes strobi]|nr:hypothetical protein [Wolbachia endosymbiont of Pissodes strobi]